MMFHDYCSICGAKRPLLLGSVIIDNDVPIQDMLMHICSGCIERGINLLDDNVIIYVKLYALHPTGIYHRVYPYDDLYLDLLPTYRPFAYRSN